VVPMNALLQHRGHVLMSAGHSIAVQNFNENLSILTMLAVYAHDHAEPGPEHHHRPVRLSIAGTDVHDHAPHQANQREHDSLALIGEHKH
jgi:LPLT family lysophospholipid transporter-like MFS transporter